MPNILANYHQNEDENKMRTQAEPPFKPIIFDSKDIFRYQQE
jgi:hypothetical protein